MGSRNARVVLIEYASFTCSHCAAFHEEVVPELKKNYIDTGKVLFVLRLFPRGMEDALAEKMARCAPRPHAISIIADRLFRDQAQWAISGKARAELVKIGQGFGPDARQRSTAAWMSPPTMPASTPSPRKPATATSWAARRTS